LSAIRIFTQDISFNLKQKKVIYNWLTDVAKHHNATISSINYILCSDDYLLKINMEYLQHDTLTDIITFPYNELKESIESDIFISIERVSENAKEFKISTLEELQRVMVHGLLHLLGQDDTNAVLKKQMKEKEDYYLSLRPEILKI
jgi:rRNA maturation RNase YbeY